MLLALVLLSLAGWLYLTFLHGLFWDPLLEQDTPSLGEWPSIDVVIPARNEAAILSETLAPLLAQAYKGLWRIILVDDHSTDGTSDNAHEVARSLGHSDRLTVLRAPDLPEGWTGKVAAMHHGAQNSVADFILFTDADIRHDPHSLARLAARAETAGLDLVSLMVKLNCTSLAEKLMIPAFVFFFAMLYPFRNVNKENSKIAGAAGGVMLLRRKVLDQVGGLSRIKNALIDDCSLASLLKKAGHKIHLTLTDNVQSLRSYPCFKDIHAMVARSAFTQLRHSALLLLGSVVGLFILFFVPIFGLFSGQLLIFFLSIFLFYIIAVLYRPMTRFYGLSPLWTLALPVAALFYIVATLDSARRYWQGQGGQWKGRAQAT